ncbi:MAG: outer rane channel, OmpJ-related [Deltaproteobacteria bacterium]|nr:outer rane channel, OmpJ-related [Deltaproteobacteria bacterium]
MRKGFLTVLAVVLVAAMAVPAMAEFTSSGFVRIKGHVEQNYNQASPFRGSFILPIEDPNTASYVEQRQRFSLNWKGENVGATALFEMDFGQWGDSAYTVGRNQGAGLEGDSINLETKNFFLYFNIPNTNAKVTAGLQNQTDSFGGMIFGYADMAGIFVTGTGGPVGYRLGWAKWAENGTVTDDDVDLYVAEVKFTPVKEVKIGVDFYVIRDASGSRTNAGITNAAPGGTFNTNLNTLGRIGLDYNLGDTNFTYDPATFYFIGVDAAGKVGPVGLSGYAFYNMGEVESATGTFAGNAITNVSRDVSAYGADLRADLDAGPGKLFIEAAYVSGSEIEDGTSDIEAPITASNYALAGSFPLTSMDTQILFPNIDDINASNALAYDVQNKGRGIIAAAAGFRMKFSDALAGKVGVGYLADAESPGPGLDEHSAVEVNANVNWTVAKGMDVGLYGAYAFLQDWESYRGPGITATTEDADDIYKMMFRMNYAF